jgi:hypothetical protein
MLQEIDNVDRNGQEWQKVNYLLEGQTPAEMKN